MSDGLPVVRCQRCGSEMDLRDPIPGETWPPQQYWVCATCGRHFWSTFPQPGRDRSKPAAPAKA